MYFGLNKCKNTNNLNFLEVIYLNEYSNNIHFLDIFSKHKWFKIWKILSNLQKNQVNGRIKEHISNGKFGYKVKIEIRF